MKKIHLNPMVIQSPDKSSIFTRKRKYSLFLDWSKIHYFESEKAARAYLNSLNRTLTGFLFEINDLYILVFTEYRRLWFSSEMGADDRAILEALANVNRCFNELMRKHDRTPEACNVVWWLDNILSELLVVVRVLHKIQKKRNNYAEIKALEIFTYRLNDLREKLKKI